MHALQEGGVQLGQNREQCNASVVVGISGITFLEQRHDGGQTEVSDKGASEKSAQDGSQHRQQVRGSILEVLSLEAQVVGGLVASKSVQGDADLYLSDLGGQGSGSGR